VIIVIARIEVDPVDLDRLRPALDAMMRATWEESGCLSYSVAIENEAGGVISVVERWADEAAMQEHVGSAHLAAFKRAMEGVTKFADVRAFDVIGERSFGL